METMKELSRAKKIGAVIAPILSLLFFAAGTVIAISASAAILYGDMTGGGIGSLIAMLILGVGVIASVVFGFAFSRWGYRYDAPTLHRASGSLLTSAVFQVALLVFSVVGVFL